MDAGVRNTEHQQGSRIGAGEEQESASYSNKCYTANCTRRLVRQYITTCRCTLRPLTSSGGGAGGGRRHIRVQSACPSPPEASCLAATKRVLSRRRPGTYFSIKHLHKTFTAYGARMQCKSFIVRIGRILRVLSVPPSLTSPLLSCPLLHAKQHPAPPLPPVHVAQCPLGYFQFL